MRTCNTIAPGSAFAPDYQPLANWSDCSPRSDGFTAKESAALNRAKRLQLGETGTMMGLSKRSDTKIIADRSAAKKGGAA
jgi:hypothetical protein